jgi:internalin A
MALLDLVLTIGFAAFTAAVAGPLVLRLALARSRFRSLQVLRSVCGLAGAAIGVLGADQICDRSGALGSVLVSYLAGMLGGLVLGILGAHLVTRWKRLQFSLRTLLLVTAAAAVGMAWWRHYSAPIRSQERTIAAVYAAGGWVTTRVVPTTWAHPEHREIETITLASPELTDAGLRILGNHTSVWRVHLPPQITDSGLEHLKGLANLQELGLSYTQVAGPGLAELSGLTKLRSLHLQHSRVTDDGLESLKELASVESLGLDGTAVTDAALRHLKAMPKLRHVSLTGTNVTKAGVDALRQSLPELNVWSDFQQAAVDALAKAGILRGYSAKLFNGALANATQINDADLAPLRELNMIQWLELENTQVTDGGLKHLEGLTNLTYLNLAKTQVSGIGLKYLKRLTKLSRLQLSDSPVTDAGLAELKVLGNLEQLSLDRSRVTDAGLEHLSNLTRLKYLRLSGTKISDAGLVYLENLTGLRALAIENTQVTDAGVSELKRALPDLHISR